MTLSDIPDCIPEEVRNLRGVLSPQNMAEHNPSGIIVALNTIYTTMVDALKHDRRVISGISAVSSSGDSDLMEAVYDNVISVSGSIFSDAKDVVNRNIVCSEETFEAIKDMLFLVVSIASMIGEYSQTATKTGDISVMTAAILLCDSMWTIFNKKHPMLGVR